MSHQRANGGLNSPSHSAPSNSSLPLNITNSQLDKPLLLSVSGYALDATDVGLPSYLPPTRKSTMSSASSFTSSAAFQLSTTTNEVGSYLDESLSTPNTYNLFGPRRPVIPNPTDFNSDPFSLASSFDSLNRDVESYASTPQSDSMMKGSESSSSTSTGTRTTSGNIRGINQGPLIRGSNQSLPDEQPGLKLTSKSMTLDDMFGDLKKDELIAFTKMLEKAKVEGMDVMDMTNAVRNHIANRAFATPAVKDWNEELQRLLDEDPSEEKYVKLRELANDFNLTAEVYAKILISELFLSSSEKTIPPSTIGGFAGGTKFICQGILFKFAVDVQIPDTDYWMYGKYSAATENAMKAAGCELRNHVAVSNALGDTNLRFPLMATIDYKGFRLVASSILPIGSHTIVYGSDNGGQNVYADPKVAEMFDFVARRLNLKKHRYGNTDLSGPVDIEIHKGEDGRYYIIDVTRLFPCEAPDLALVKHPRSNYFQMLRPCLVGRFHKPLSSDAFSGFGKDGEEIHNEEVRQATRFLFDTAIIQMADALNLGAVKTRDSFHLCTFLHKAGINLRYLGLLRSHLKDPVETSSRRFSNPFVNKNRSQVSSQRAQASLVQCGGNAAHTRERSHTSDASPSQFSINTLNLDSCHTSDTSPSQFSINTLNLGSSPSDKFIHPPLSAPSSKTSSFLSHSGSGFLSSSSTNASHAPPSPTSFSAARSRKNLQLSYVPIVPDNSSDNGEEVSIIRESRVISLPQAQLVPARRSNRKMEYATEYSETANGHHSDSPQDSLADTPTFFSSSLTNLPSYSLDSAANPNAYSLRQLVLVEMIARVLKCKLRKLWRQTMQIHKISILAPFAETALKILNMVFFKEGEKSDHFWSTTLINDILSKYAVGLTEDERTGKVSLYHNIDTYQLLRRFCFMTGMKVNMSRDQLIRSDRKFMYTDIESIGCVVTSMNLVTLSEGILLKMMASREKQNALKLDLLNLSEHYLSAAYIATFSPLITAEIAHVHYLRMEVGEAETQQLDAEDALMGYSDALTTYTKDFSGTDGPAYASVPVLARTGSLGTLRLGGTIPTASFVSTTALKLLEVALFWLHRDPSLQRFMRCDNYTQVCIKLSRAFELLYKTHSQMGVEKEIHPISKLIRTVIPKGSLSFLLDIWINSGPEMMEIFRKEFASLDTLNLSGIMDIWGTEECCFPHMLSLCRLAEKAFHLSNLTILDLSGCYTVMESDMEAILPIAPNLEQMNLSGCRRLTNKFYKIFLKGRSINNRIVSLNLSECFQLEDEFFFEITNILSNLTALNISKCTKVTESVISLLSKKCPKLVNLSIAGCTSITSFLSLEAFPSLTDIDLSSNTNLDPSILKVLLSGTRIPAIRSLRLSHNLQIDDAAFSDINVPLPDLQSLYLNDTSITQTAIETFIQYAPGISALDVSDCQLLSLSAIGDRIGAFNRLRVFSAKGQLNFAAGLIVQASNQTLETFHLTPNMNMLATSLSKARSDTITSLVIARSPDHTTTLLEAAKFSSLTHLSVSGCLHFTDGTLRGVLKDIPHLQVLDLSFCAQLSASCIPIIAKSGSNLRVLDLDFCSGIEEPNLMEIGLRCLSLTELGLSRIPIRSASKFSPLFRRNLSTLRVLRLRESFINDECVKDIASFSPFLSEIDLSDNPELTNGSIRSLIQNCPALTNVTLTGAHQLTDSVFVKSSKKRLLHLRTLNLSGCRFITDATIHTLTKRCSMLNYLNLSSCDLVTADAIKVLIGACRYLSDLRVICCEGIPKGELDTMLLKNRVLRVQY